MHAPSGPQISATLTRMKLFRSKDSKKKHEKAKQAKKGSVSDSPVGSLPPNQDPANTVTYIERSVQQPEVRVETLKAAAPPRNHAADPPQASFESSQPPPRSLKEAPAIAHDNRASALKESYGVDPVAQMAHNSVTRKLVKQFIADIWNRGDLDLIPSLCAKGIRCNGSSGMARVGHAGFKKMVTNIRNSVEDCHCEIHSMVVEGNKAFCRLRFMGRHVGELLGYEPTGRQVSWMGAMEFTVIDGLIVKVWELVDTTSLEQEELGTIDTTCYEA